MDLLVVVYCCVRELVVSPARALCESATQASMQAAVVSLASHTRTMDSTQGVPALTLLTYLEEMMTRAQPSVDALYSSVSQIRTNFDTLVAGEEDLVAGQVVLGDFAEQQVNQSARPKSCYDFRHRMR